MQLRHAYCLASEYIKPDECDRIVEICEKLPTSTAGTAKGTDPDGTKRRSNIAWLADNPAHKWIYQRINLCVATANKQYWHWRMAGHEPLQYTTYGPGQYYQWHTDAAAKPYSETSQWPGMLRKISVTVQLCTRTNMKAAIFCWRKSAFRPNAPAKGSKRSMTRGSGARSSCSHRICFIG